MCQGSASIYQKLERKFLNQETCQRKTCHILSCTRDLPRCLKTSEPKKQGQPTAHFAGYLSEGLNRLRNSDLVLKKTSSFAGKILAQNFVTLENKFLSFSDGQISLENALQGQ